MGNISPDSSMMGIIKPIPEASMAAIWLFTKVEMSSPKDKAKKINRKEVRISSRKFPAIGTPRTYTERSNMVVRLSIESRK